MTLASIFSPPSSNANAAKLARHLRALPPRDVEQLQLPGVPGPADAFLDQLVELPSAKWLAIGEALVADRDGIPVRQRSWEEVDATLIRGRLGLAVWRVREAVDTVAFLATREWPRWSRHERRVFAAAHGAAEAAALALLARDELPVEAYRALTAPFASCVPATESN
ncbi:MAG TPA: hypothetical protein VJO33_11335 [Gemmatimonadaceae bacterium]|nr:hypothetical protein [Gemmatimonadaceae bacterium]